MQILKQAEGGVPVVDLCLEHGMSSASFYKWRSKYGGMDAALLSLSTDTQRLERGNRRLVTTADDLSQTLGLLA